MRYSESNRYKLKQFLKSIGMKKQLVSLQLGKGLNYLSNTSSKSEFKNRGDLPESKLNSIKKKLTIDFNSHDYLYVDPIGNQVAFKIKPVNCKTDQQKAWLNELLYTGCIKLI